MTTNIQGCYFKCQKLSAVISEEACKLNKHGDKSRRLKKRSCCQDCQGPGPQVDINKEIEAKPALKGTIRPLPKLSSLRSSSPFLSIVKGI